MSSEPVTYHFRHGETDARAQWRGDDFVILQGSRIWIRPMPRSIAYIEREREDHLQRGLVGRDGFVHEDIPFTSPSRAASYAHGASVPVKNTERAWRDADGNDPIRRTE